MTSKYDVRWSHEAKKRYEKLGAAFQERFHQMVACLEENPYHHAKSIKRLTGPLAGLFRFRIGTMRVFYTISESE